MAPIVAPRRCPHNCIRAGRPWEAPSSTLAQRHGCGSRVDSVVVTAGNRRILRFPQLTAADKPPGARRPLFSKGRASRAPDDSAPGLPHSRDPEARGLAWPYRLGGLSPGELGRGRPALRLRRASRTATRRLPIRLGAGLGDLSIRCVALRHKAAGGHDCRENPTHSETRTESGPSARTRAAECSRHSKTRRRSDDPWRRPSWKCRRLSERWSSGCASRLTYAPRVR